MKRLTTICQPFDEESDNTVLIMNLPCDGNCLIKSRHVQFMDMHIHKIISIRVLGNPTFNLISHVGSN